MSTDRIWTLIARKLTGEASANELSELEQLIRENPEIHLQLQAVTETWGKEHPNNEMETHAAYERHLNKLRESQGGWEAELDDEGAAFRTIRTSRRFRRQLLVAAAVLILLAGFGIWKFGSKNENNNAGIVGVSTNNSITTKLGSRTKVELPDGSVVWLNAGSTLTYDKQFGETDRIVKLIGEGFFEVVHNDEKPFIIHTTYVDIRDIGTRFNVKCYANDKTTETSLIEGSVEVLVKKRGEKYFLKPNQKLVLLNDSFGADSIFSKISKNKISISEPLVAIRTLTYKPKDSVAVETAWTYNKLSFEDELFSEVAKKMARWYDCEIEFRNKKFETEYVSGSFTPETLEQAMEALKFTYGFRYEIKDKRVIIY
jgi:ferric-dicitrate binding protein FerR (iron transport regulator)